MKIPALIFLIAFTSAVQAYKVLVMVPINGKSHWNYMQVFIKEFLQRGHEVTTITSQTISGPKHVNYTEILIENSFSFQSIVKPEEIFAKESNSPFEGVSTFPFFGTISTNHTLSDIKIQEFIRRNDLHFDIVINEEVHHDAFLMFGRKFNAPVVTICPYGMASTFDGNMGLITPVSHVSHTILPYTDQMNFAQRWFNAILWAYDWINYRFVLVPAQNQIINKHFGHLDSLQPLPSVDDLRKNISIVFVNAHRSITHQRPKMDGLVYIGGAHIKPPKPLPADLQQFLDEAKDGVIYFSLGTVVTTSAMPKEKINIFLDTFKKLKQRVIWKFEDESLETPPNVLIKKWLPQSDILAHKNIVLFITHGGMFSNFEANKYGVPLLVIPFVCDQYRNAQRVQSAGYGIHLNFKSITHDTLAMALNDVLTDKKYYNRAKEIEAIFAANLVHPMDEFIWWVEYVINFRGAKHLKSAASDMSVFTYLLLDVILVNLLIASATICSVYYLIKRIVCTVKSVSIAKKFI